MESIGQQLKAARERRQMTIADISAATKMLPSVVAALEADNFGALVAPIYARGFIKLYAECVGLDSFALLQQPSLAEALRPGKFGAAGARMPPPRPAAAQAPSAPSAVAAQEESPAVVLLPAPISPEQAQPGEAAVAAAGKPKPAPTAANDRARRPSSGFSGPLSVVRRLASVFMSLLLVKRWPACIQMTKSGSITGRLSRAWTFVARLEWPRFRLPADGLRRIQFSAQTLQRFLIVALVALLIIAAGVVWTWGSRRVPRLTDEYRWVAEPPEPYLDMEARPVPSMKTPTRPP
ncbi:MAG: helix-turn-helix domain-containing protein [Lentisphaerae bacterium]|nr:helix-turn-helix domain-containing protein [Lentisphaerota bacterium]